RLAPHPDLQVQTVIAPAQVTAGATVDLKFTVINQGTVATPSRWTDKVFLSLDDRVSSDDIVIGTPDNGAALAGGESYGSNVLRVTIPRYFRDRAYLIVRTDADEAVNEFPNEDNNTFAHRLEIVPLPPSDLVTSNVVAPAQVIAGSAVEVRYRVSNL